jgi:hypothetical protein
MGLIFAFDGAGPASAAPELSETRRQFNVIMPYPGTLIEMPAASAARRNLNCSGRTRAMPEARPDDTGTEDHTRGFAGCTVRWSAALP